MARRRRIRRRYGYRQLPTGLKFRPPLPEGVKLTRQFGWRLQGWARAKPTAFRTRGVAVPATFEELPLHFQLLLASVPETSILGGWLQGVYGGNLQAFALQSVDALQRKPPFAQVYTTVGELGWLTGLAGFGTGPSYVFGAANTAYRAGWLGVNMGDQYQYENFIQSELGAANLMRTPEGILAHLARAGYGQAQQRMAGTLFGLNMVKLASYFNTRLTPVRALSFPFTAAYRNIAVTASMASSLSLLYQINPQYTESLISGPSASGYFAALNYSSTVPSLISGLGEWTFGQMGIWGLRQGFRQTLKSSLGLSLLQPGLQLTMDMLTTSTLRQLLGMPAFFNSDEENTFRMQSALGAGLSVAGAGIMGAQALGYLGGPISFNIAPTFSEPYVLASTGAYYFDVPISQSRGLQVFNQFGYGPVFGAPSGFTVSPFIRGAVADYRFRSLATGRFISLEQIKAFGNISRGLSTALGFAGFVAGATITDYLYSNYADEWLQSQGVNPISRTLIRIGVDVGGGAALGLAGEWASRTLQETARKGIERFVQTSIGRAAAVGLGIASGILEAYMAVEITRMSFQTFAHLQEIAASVSALRKLEQGQMLQGTTVTMPGPASGGWALEWGGPFGVQLVKQPYAQFTVVEKEGVLWSDPVSMFPGGDAATAEYMAARGLRVPSFNVPYTAGMEAWKQKEQIADPNLMRALSLEKIRKMWAANPANWDKILSGQDVAQKISLNELAGGGSASAKFNIFDTLRRMALGSLNLAMLELSDAQNELKSAYDILQIRIGIMEAGYHTPYGYGEAGKGYAFDVFYKTYMDYLSHKLTALQMANQYSNRSTLQSSVVGSYLAALPPDLQELASEWFADDFDMGRAQKLDWAQRKGWVSPQARTSLEANLGVPSHLEMASFRNYVAQQAGWTAAVQFLEDLYSVYQKATKTAGEDPTQEYLNFLAGEIVLNKYAGSLESGANVAPFGFEQNVEAVNSVLQEYGSGNLNVGQTIAGLNALGYNAYFDPIDYTVEVKNVTGTTVTLFDLKPAFAIGKGSYPVRRGNEYVSGFSGHGWYYHYDPLSDRWTYDPKGNFKPKGSWTDDPAYSGNIGIGTLGGYYYITPDQVPYSLVYRSFKAKAKAMFYAGTYKGPYLPEWDETDV